jgi:3-oxoacyl-[acyl-carrier protein] reductase
MLLAQAGANVVIGYNSDHAAARSILEDLKVSGHHTALHSGDISDPETVRNLFETARREFGTIDIVVGNAGIWKKSSIDEMSEKDWQETIDVNLKSIYLTCRQAVREMKPRRSGNIILISSTAGQRGEPYYSHYAATKGAIIAMTKSLAAELGPWNIRVNAVAPGWVTTDMCREVMSDPARREAIQAEIPLGRIASAQDIAGPILFLASALASHVHGEVLNVNGGSVLCG